MSMIGVSKRRCATFAEMSEKIAASLVNLQMDCNRMAGYIRNDPQGLNRLGIWLNAARVALEKDKEHLDEQIQIELFLQGELERWLNGEPPSDFAPPPPGMMRQPPMRQPQMPAPQYPHQLEQEPAYPPQYPPQHLLPPHLREPKPAPHPSQVRQGPPPRMQAPQSQLQPQQRPTQQRPVAPVSTPSEPLLPPSAAFAAYHPQRHAQQPQAPQRMPVVRLPVEQYAPAQEVSAQTQGGQGDDEEVAPQNHQANGPSALPIRDAEDDDKSTASPS